MLIWTGLVWDGSRHVGPETLEHGFSRRVERLLADYSQPAPGPSHYVGLTYKRPLPPWPTVKCALQELLNRLSSEEVPSHRVEAAHNLWIELLAAEHQQDRFSLVSIEDLEDGCWLMEELTESINHCLTEKWGKTVTYRHRYANWWLVLVDYISHLGLSSREASQLASALPNLKRWDSVVLINSLRPPQSLTLHE